MTKYLLFFSFLLPINLFAQNISGTITSKNDEALVGASVYWLSTSIGTFTDEQGNFSIPKPTAIAPKLVVSFVGYISDTLLVEQQNIANFQLEASEVLAEIVITDRKDGVTVSSINPIKTENITSTELRKAACCDLAGCFGTQSTVETQVTNVITNAKELRIAGLAGVYNQVLVNGFPMIQGLTYTYGISGIPGTLVNNIFITKGINSVLQGYESISGQINVITKAPDTKEKLFLNAYINSFAEKHFNAHTSFEVGEWKNILAIHTVQPADKTDGDEDNFLDLPQLTRYMVTDKWTFGKFGEWGWSSEIGLRFLKEKRIGGQSNYNAKTDGGSTEIYGQQVQLNQPEIWTKTAYRFDDVHEFSLYFSSFYQDQDAWFGTVKYDAQQTNIYANFQYEYDYSEQNSLKTGISYRYLNLKEDIGFTDTNLERTYQGFYQNKENIPGFFAENSMRLFNNKLTWIAGIRGDQHSQFGFTFTPRTLLKYDIDEKTIVRGNIGTGWRTVNLFSENIGLLVSSRDILFAEALEPERATNIGVNLFRKVEGLNISGYFTADFYHTNFQNQIFPDYDSNPTLAIIKNFKGTSISNSFQAEASVSLYKTTTLKIGYNFLDVYRKDADAKQSLPFNSKHKFLAVLGYRPLSNKFSVDVNAHWYGQQRLPNTSANPIAFQRPNFSQSYTLINAQFTYNFKQLEIYTGCENIFDFRQNQPILSWENPFGKYFDTSSVWGPTRGREFYLGLRFRLGKMD